MSEQPDNEQRLRESISAWMDGEADQLESRRLEKELDQSVELKAYWSRQQLIRQALHRQLDGQVDLRADISAAVKAGIENQPLHNSKVKVSDDVLPNKKTNPFAGFAIAASIALAVFIGFNQQSSDVSDQTLKSTTTLASNYVPSGNVQTVSLGAPKKSNTVTPQQYSVSRVQVPAEMSAHLQRYYAEHAEQAAFSGSYGLLPYARTSGEF